MFKFLLTIFCLITTSAYTYDIEIQNLEVSGIHKKFSELEKTFDLFALKGLPFDSALEVETSQVIKKEEDDEKNLISAVVVFHMNKKSTSIEEFFANKLAHLLQNFPDTFVVSCKKTLMQTTNGAEKIKSRVTYTCNLIDKTAQNYYNVLDENIFSYFESQISITNVPDGDNDIYNNPKKIECSILANFNSDLKKKFDDPETTGIDETNDFINLYNKFLRNLFKDYTSSVKN